MPTIKLNLRTDEWKTDYNVLSLVLDGGNWKGKLLLHLDFLEGFKELGLNMDLGVWRYSKR